MNKKIRVFEAFAGYGSQSIALRNIGVPYEVVGISEIDKYAIKAYEAMHGKVNNLGDISKIKAEDIPEHDLFTYSFPCQDISTAGKQASLEERSGTRSSLLWECRKIIATKKPRYLLMENVKNLVSKKHKPYFDKWLEYLEGLGYTNYWEVLNAKDYGVPQNRERVFVVSVLGIHEPYEFPKGFKLEKNIKSILEDNVEDKYYLDADKVSKMKIRIPSPSSDVKNIGNTHPSGKGMNGNVFDSNGISPTLTTNKGEGIKIALPCICASRGRNPQNPNSRVAGLPTEQMIEINVNGVSNTLTTVQKDNYVFDNYQNPQIRKLTPKECFRLMGMSDDDINKIQSAGISDTQQYKMAGNSIVVQVLEYIFEELLLS